MKRALCVAILLMGMAAVSGCSGAQMIGMVGDLEMWSIRDHSWDGPNMCALVSRDPKTGQIVFHGMGNGPGLFGGAGTALVGSGAQAGGIVGGAAVLRPSKTLNLNSTITQTQQNNANHHNNGVGPNNSPP